MRFKFLASVIVRWVARRLRVDVEVHHASSKKGRSL